MLIHLDDLKRRVANAALGGGRKVGPITWEWDCSGSCNRRMTREFYARKDRRQTRHNDWSVGEAQPLRLIQHLRCRKCEECRKMRSRLWRARALEEFRRAPRTWFGTLTLRPEEHDRVGNLTRQRLRTGGTDFDLLPQSKQFLERHKTIRRELGLYFKRIRKESGAPLRFLLVAEMHTDQLNGLPHYHVLIHERVVGQEVHKRTLDSQWKLGFTKFRLAAKKHCGYTTKYLSKDMEARVVASLHYGNPPITVFNHSGDDVVDIRGDSGGMCPPDNPQHERHHVKETTPTETTHPEPHWVRVPLDATF